MSSKLRVVYAGTPAVALPALINLRESQHELLGILTRPDTAQGRKGQLTPSQVAQTAQPWHLPLIKTSKPAPKDLAALKPDIGVVVSYGALLTPEVLAVPRWGWINLHFSLLPDLRGAAPVQRAILAGKELSGFSIFALEAELDSGPILLSREHTFSPELNAAQELMKMAELSAPYILEVLDDLPAKLAAAAPQQGQATYAAKLRPEEGQISWSQSAESITCLVRAFNPNPGAYTFQASASSTEKNSAGRRIKILAARPSGLKKAVSTGSLLAIGKKVYAAAGDGLLELLTIQPEGKKAMSAYAWWCGLKEETVFL